MPADTFRNLPEEKRMRIFQAAVAEFAQQPFSQASINRIVKDAGIPRGSFYQYFADKEDLYLYVITEIGKEKLAAIHAAEELSPDAGFFETVLHMARTALAWAHTQPVFNRIGTLMELDNSAFISKLKAMSREGISEIEKLIVRDQQRGWIRSDIDPGFLLDVFYSVNIKLLSDYYRDGGSDEALMEKLAAAADLLKRGASHEHPAS